MWSRPFRKELRFREKQRKLHACKTIIAITTAKTIIFSQSTPYAPALVKVAPAHDSHESTQRFSITKAHNVSPAHSPADQPEQHAPPPRPSPLAPALAVGSRSAR